ncbi:hypothetical protein AALO_G00045550, partial [Alosa alosa]
GNLPLSLPNARLPAGRRTIHACLTGLRAVLVHGLFRHGALSVTYTLSQVMSCYTGVVGLSHLDVHCAHCCFAEFWSVHYPL